MLSDFDALDRTPHQPLLGPPLPRARGYDTCRSLPWLPRYLCCGIRGSHAGLGGALADCTTSIQATHGALSNVDTNQVSTDTRWGEPVATHAPVAGTGRAGARHDCAGRHCFRAVVPGDWWDGLAAVAGRLADACAASGRGRCGAYVTVRRFG
jgi:hypothetical protein